MDGILKIILLGSSLAIATSIVADAHDHPVERRVQVSGWVCNAYGNGGKRNTWRTVSGPRKTTEAEAKAAALNDCRASILGGCRPSGCWKE